ncbi:hypothetical protein KP78_37320 [Jeotgalibacillus soli]|uniref:Uncharacterized protein n=2 Tax=Jeotgalibacillus soli TaxID=889306 RepID=A0A0C2VIT5_9BACL|nr:hypothetical protein KP78_37320 [Jeotgalibacillus soli]
MAVILILSSIGKWRTYLFEADRIFLVRRPEWLKSIPSFSLLYNTAASILYFIFIMVLFLPYAIRTASASIGQ